MLLYQSGWHIKRVFLLCVQSMNNVKNAPRASSPAPGRAATFEDFNRAVEILRELERKGLVDMAYEPPSQDKASPTLVLQIPPEAANLSAFTELRKLLNLTRTQSSYPIVYAQVQHVRLEARQTLQLDTRSMLGIMYYLSQAVEAPAADVHSGRVGVTQTETGEPFDWKQLFGGVFEIKNRSSKPDNASIAVRYRGSWFYIDDSDLSSKSTFVMLSQIFSLQAGKAEGIAPVLTLPVGR